MTERHHDGGDGAGFGGGIFIAVFLLVGAGIGVFVGQPSLGVLGGLGVGVCAAVVHWLIRRSRK